MGVRRWAREIRERLGRSPLRTQLLLYTVAVATPLLVLVALGARAVTKDEDGHAREASAAIAATAAHEVAEELEHLQSLLAKLAARPRVRALDPSGCDPILAELIGLEPLLLDAVTFRADGTVVCSARGGPVGVRISNPGAGMGRRPSGVTWGTYSRRHIARLADPLSAPDGVAGAITFVLDLEAFTAPFRGQTFPASAEVYVVDADGKVVWSSGMPGGLGQPAAELGLPGAGTTRIGAEQVTDHEGRRHVVSRVPIRGSTWVAVAALPAELAFAGARARALHTALAALAALAAMLLAARHLAVLITRPVATLAATARASRLGDDLARAPITGPPEVAEVARELNAALDQRREVEAVRARAVSVLRESEARHREIAELVSDLALTWRVGPDGRFEREWSTERLDRLLGIRAGRRYDEQVHAALHPDHVPVLASARERLVREPCTIEYDLRWRRATDGAWRWVHHTARSIHETGPGGHQVRILHSGTDVTDACEAARAREVHRAWEELEAATSHRFLAAATDALEAELAPALERVRAFLGVDAAVITEVRADGGLPRAWARCEEFPEQALEVHTPAAEFPIAFAELRRGAPFAFDRLDALEPRAPIDAASCRRRSVEALLLQPLLSLGGVCVGALSFGSRSPRVWTEAELRHTGVIARQFSKAIARLDADRALRQSEARYRDLFEHAGDAILVTDPRRGVIVAANRRTEALTGRSPAELVGAPVTSIVPPEDAEFVTREYRAHVTDAGRVTRLRLLRPDGTTVPVEIASMSCVEDGEPRLIGIARDLSERQRAEEETRQLKEFYATVLDSVREGILVTDAAAVIQYANRATARILAVSREQLVGKPISECVPAESADAAAVAQYQRARLLLQPAPYERRARLADGREVVQSGWFVPLLRGGAFDGMVCTAEDVTERRVVEETLRRTQDQFLQAQKMEAVGRLAGGVAHDFNNILSVILSYAEMLQDELPARDPRRDDAREIVVAARAGANLTRQLLAFSRKQVAAPRVVRLGELVAGAEKLLRRLIGEDVAFEVAGTDAPARVRVDPGHLEQVLLNLAVNARDAMPGGGRLSISVGAIAPEAPLHDGGERVAPGRWATITVRDTGCGMDASTRAHAFEPFFTTKGPGKGTGLGLATVYGIVQQAGGHVVVESAPGAGATFRIYLPEVDADVEDVFERIPEAPPARPAPRDDTVLVVEDDAPLRQVMERVLAGAGYRVLAAASGDEAIRTAAGHRAPIRLLVSDVVMPGMNGRDLATRLAAARPELRTLFISGYTEDILGPHGVLDHDTHLLHKPFTQPQLLEAVRRRLSRAA